MSDGQKAAGEEEGGRDDKVEKANEGIMWRKRRRKERWGTQRWMDEQSQ